MMIASQRAPATPQGGGRGGLRHFRRSHGGGRRRGGDRLHWDHHL